MELIMNQMAYFDENPSNAMLYYNRDNRDTLTI